MMSQTHNSPLDQQVQDAQAGLVGEGFEEFGTVAHAVEPQ